ncbi:unnamed protein product [Cylicocyclus nassatus]|uniref:Tc1-like transposase DDE domain-containing protein n=1 Tax=Cylicocyclus nassatus TaxID=53992 RepID=A0AA36MBD8_CYLNA|nr:unnamed protein product [Cylicocyclus nassatus]
MAKNGILPGCTKLVLCGKRDEEYDYHQDMDHQLFEQWLENSIPHMQDRQLLKVPTARSTKKCISDYLVAKGVAIGNKSTKFSLLAELQLFMASKGGLSAVREYAVDRRRSEMGVNFIRLPPFHCMFNPIELCWGQMKAHLTKHGKTTDRLGMVKTRAVEWLANVPSSLTESWFREARKLENAARQKQHDDSLADEISGDNSSEYSSEIDDLELEEIESDLELEELESDLDLEKVED